MADAACQALVNSPVKVINNTVSSDGNRQCCLKMQSHIQTLEREIKSLTEIVKILNAERKYDATTVEVRKTNYTSADKLKANTAIDYKQNQIKPQPLGTIPRTARTKPNTSTNDFSYKKLMTNKNSYLAISSSSVVSNKTTAPFRPKSSLIKPSPKPSQYTIPTENQFDILSDNQDLQLDNLCCSSNFDSSPIFPPRNNSVQPRSFHRKKSTEVHPTATLPLQPQDLNIRQETVKKEEGTYFIPTIVNGVLSAPSNQEAMRTTSDMNSASVNSVIADLRVSINALHDSNPTTSKHQILLIGDSNIRGYAGALEPLLPNNFKLYSVVKPGSTSNELEASASESISRLTKDDMIILCYGTNDLDFKTKLFDINTFTNYKKFITNNNHTNILIMNIPHRFDLPDSQNVNKIITSLNRKLQKLVKGNQHTSFLETLNNRNLFTNHGLHRSKLGKRLVKFQLTSSLLAAFVKNTSNIIPLEWCKIYTVSDDNGDIKQSNSTNRNSHRNRKIPVTRTDDFLWLN